MIKGLRISLSKDFSRWEDFLLKDDGGNIFQSTVMIPAYSRELKFKPYLVVAKLNNEIVGGMLTYRRVHPKIPIPLINELYTPYGPIVSKEVEESIKNKILEKLLRTTKGLVNLGTIKHTFFVRSDFIYDQIDTTIQHSDNKDIFEKVNYERVPNGYAQTFIVDLEQDPEFLLKNFEKKTRWSLKKAKKLNVKAIIDNTGEGLEKFYKLYVDTAKRHGSIVTPFNFLNKLHEILSTKNMMDVYLAYFDDIPITAAIILNYKNTAYYYMSASMKKYGYTQANTFLQFFVMTNARERGIKKYDLLCTPSSDDRDNPQYGLYLFKRSFGGRSVSVFHHEKIFNKWLNVSADKLLHIYERLPRK